MLSSTQMTTGTTFSAPKASNQVSPPRMRADDRFIERLVLYAGKDMEVDMMHGIF